MFAGLEPSKELAGMMNRWAQLEYAEAIYGAGD
jgi:hypothetical protein